MKKTLSVILIFTMLFTTMCMSVSAKEVNNVAYRIYVSISGNDNTGDGSAAKPFATISKAKDHVRTLDKTSGDIVVEIGEGTYKIIEAIVFDEKDSGSDNCTIHYVAAEGAEVILSGGNEVTGEWEYEGKGVYSITYNRDKKLRSLYINGQRAFMTSKVVKGQGSFGEYNIKGESADWAWIDGTEKAGTIFKAKDIPTNTRNADDIELMTQTTWNTSIVCVDSLEKKFNKVYANLQMPYGAIAQTPGWGNDYKFEENNTVYNVFEWLGKPGEFYFDKSEHKLYYCPRENEDLATAKVVVPETEELIRLEGKSTADRVHNISFEGLTFAYTDWNLCEVDGSFGRATNQAASFLFAYAQEFWHEYIYRAYDLGPAAINVESASDITFKNNIIRNTGNDGLTLENDAVNITVEGNVFFDTAGSQLVIGHPQHMYIGDKNSDYGIHSDKEKYDVGVEGVCKDLTITNNLFKNTCRLFWGGSAVMVFVTENMLFKYNDVENTPYSGISLGWGWWNMNGDQDAIVPQVPTTTTKNNKILNNKFTNTITKLSDTGAIYTLGDMPGTVISENYILGIGSLGGHSYHIRGIHVDEGTMHVYGEKNVIDIDESHAAIDCGWWGKKGYNVWNNNYSTSPSYTTTDSYEIGTIITNAHHVPDRNWDETALKVIDNAGIREDYPINIPDDIKNAAPDSGEFSIHDCGHICHKAGFMGFVYKIALGFWKLFKTNKTCECGMNHW